MRVWAKISKGKITALSATEEEGWIEKDVEDKDVVAYRAKRVWTEMNGDGDQIVALSSTPQDGWQEKTLDDDDVIAFRRDKLGQTVDDTGKVE